MYIIFTVMKFEKSVKKLREHYKRIEAGRKRAILIAPLPLRRKRKKKTK